MIEPLSICCLRCSYSRRDILSALNSSSSLSICRFAWISYPAPVASTPVAAPPRKAQPDWVTTAVNNRTIMSSYLEPLITALHRFIRNRNASGDVHEKLRNVKDNTPLKIDGRGTGERKNSAKKEFSVQRSAGGLESVKFSSMDVRILNLSPCALAFDLAGPPSAMMISVAGFLSVEKCYAFCSVA